MRLLQVRLGPVRRLVDGQGKTWSSAIGKDLANSPVRVGPDGLEGDEVADRRHHGGPWQALLAYSVETYALWRSEGLPLDPGAFGENILVEGATDREICIGDLWETGGLRLRVCQPRQPCETLARFHGNEDLVARVWEQGRGGCFLRVLQGGLLSPGPVRLVERPHPGWSVARVLRAFDRAKDLPEEAQAASALEHLSPGWRSKLLLKAST